jgi:hypothetical protein
MPQPVVALFALSLLATMGACSNSDICPKPALPACPAGATCGGPCDPEASITSCALGCGASCGDPHAYYQDAGTTVYYDAGTRWNCLAP